MRTDSHSMERPLSSTHIYCRNTHICMVITQQSELIGFTSCLISLKLNTLFSAFARFVPIWHKRQFSRFDIILCHSRLWMDTLRQTQSSTNDTLLTSWNNISSSSSNVLGSLWNFIDVLFVSIQLCQTTFNCQLSLRTVMFRGISNLNSVRS